MEIRKFETGATRDTDNGKYDYEAFLSPLVIQRYGQYMHEHRKQADGTLRDGDNWQRGIPLTAYMKSLWRHVFQVWMIHRGELVYDTVGNRVYLEDALCAIMFNTMGYLHETLKLQKLAAR